MVWEGRTGRGGTRLARTMSARAWARAQLPTHPNLAGCGGGLPECVSMREPTPTGSFCPPASHSPSLLPQMEESKDLAQSLRERSQIPLNPGDEGY